MENASKLRKRKAITSTSNDSLSSMSAPTPQKKRKAGTKTTNAKRVKIETGTIPKRTKKENILANLDEVDGNCNTTTSTSSNNENDNSSNIWSEAEMLSTLGKIPIEVASNFINLLSEGCTLPFIARYRKTAVNNLMPDRLQALYECYENITQLKKKVKTVIDTLKRNNKLSLDIKKSILSARNLSEVDLIYAPLKTHSLSLAERARNLGLESYAVQAINGEYIDLRRLCRDDEELATVDKVETHVTHIVADIIYKDTRVLEHMRSLKEETRFTIQSSRTKSSTKEKNNDKKLDNKADPETYKLYFEWKCPSQFIKAHQILALNRGEDEKVLSVKVIIPDWFYNKLERLAAKQNEEKYIWRIKPHTENKLLLFQEKESFKNFINRLETYMHMTYCQDPKIMTYVLLSSLNPELHERVCNLCLSTGYIRIHHRNLNLTDLRLTEDPSNLDFYDLGKLLEQYIDPKPSVWAGRHKYLTRIQGETATVTNISTELKRLAHDCEFYCDHCKKPIADNFLALKLIRGIRDSETHIKILQDNRTRFCLSLWKSSFWVRKGLGDAYNRLIKSWLSRHVRGDLTISAQKEAVKTFTTNLEKYLLTEPIKNRTIAGLDPGFRAGCKVGIINCNGEKLEACTIHPDLRQHRQTDIAAKQMKDLIQKHSVELIGLGNGTACRETELWLKNHHISDNVPVIIVPEQGASVYSISKEAQKEHPNMDPNLISALSIARRVLDPLGELIKVDPKNLGVGLYQHDIPPKMLESALDSAVEKVVSLVGVDINTASQAMLRRISGLNEGRAKKIIAYRQDKGGFSTRAEILKVPGIGKVTFQQCAGFLTVLGSSEPLDTTIIHPESYNIAKAFAKKIGVNLKKLTQPDFPEVVDAKVSTIDISKTSEELKTDTYTLELIINAFKQKKYEDNIIAFCKPVYSVAVQNMEQLTEGTTLTGVVRNVVPFGCFVDCGVGGDGLIHRSNLGGNQTPKLGDRVSVTVIASPKPKKIQLRLERILD